MGIFFNRPWRFSDAWRSDTAVWILHAHVWRLQILSLVSSHTCTRTICLSLSAYQVSNCLDPCPQNKDKPKKTNTLHTLLIVHKRPPISLLYTPSYGTLLQPSPTPNHENHHVDQKQQVTELLLCFHCTAVLWVRVNTETEPITKPPETGHWNSNWNWALNWSWNRALELSPLLLSTETEPKWVNSSWDWLSL